MFVLMPGFFLISKKVVGTHATKVALGLGLGEFGGEFETFSLFSLCIKFVRKTGLGTVVFTRAVFRIGVFSIQKTSIDE